MRGLLTIGGATVVAFVVGACSASSPAEDGGAFVQGVVVTAPPVAAPPNAEPTSTAPIAASTAGVTETSTTQTSSSLRSSVSSVSSTISTTTSSAPRGAATNGAVAKPDWLGTRLLPLRADGNGEALATPAELIDRRFITDDVLDPPTSDEFESTISAVPDEVLARSTWHIGCPVTVDQLSYLTLTFWGFDGRHHRGEMIVNAKLASLVVDAFRSIDEARFPIEEMRVTRADELDAHPTGDGNNTGSFVCRPTTGSTGWSNHAYGRAIDINPFHNPYAKGDLVVPELASAYLDRANLRPGMIHRDSAVHLAFAASGWGWGGDFKSLTDTMHFSVTGH